jgi:glycosyltransferase involved in cell wall biosynthesis
MKPLRRVLFLTEWYPTEENPVAGVFVREHARAAALSSEVVVIHWLNRLGERGRPPRFWHDLAESASSGIDTFRLETRGSGARSDLRTAVAMIRAYRMIRRRGFVPDVIHAHIFRAAFHAVILGYLFRTPVVATEQWSAFPLGLLSRQQWRIAKIAFRGSKCVLPVSRALERAIEAHGITFRSKIVPNVVDTDLFSLPAAERPSRSRQTALLFVGLMSDDDIKGLSVLLEALARSGDAPRFRLDVIGDGPARTEYERRVRRLGLSDAVTFHGLLPKARVADFMRGADLLVAPSRYDNLPCVVAEALVSGLPVLSTRTGGIPEMVGDNDGLLVSPGEVDALAEGLDQAISRLAVFDRAGIAERAITRYGLASVGSELDAVYAGVTSPPM